jgi:hypothetical protein
MTAVEAKGEAKVEPKDERTTPLDANRQPEWEWLGWEV